MNKNEIKIKFKIFINTEGILTEHLTEPLATYYDAIQWLERNAQSPKQYCIIEIFYIE